MPRSESRLIFSDLPFREIQERLLASSPDESATFLYARATATPAGGWRFLVVGERPIRDHEYDQRSEVSLQISHAVVADVCSRARREGFTVILVHSHPAQSVPSPSTRDLAGEQQLVPLFARQTGQPVLRLIIGRSGVSCAALGEKGDVAVAVWQIGRHVSRIPGEVDAEAPPASIYDRQVRAFGADGQARLSSLAVGLVGLGGTGSLVAQQLAHLGVRDFTLIDPDDLEDTNLNRVVGAAQSDVGRKKVDVASDLITRVNPSAQVRPVAEDVRRQDVVRILLDVDVIFGCTDSHGSRHVLQTLAYQFAVPIFDVGVVVDNGEGQASDAVGRAQMLVPGNRCFSCDNVLDADTVRRELQSEEARVLDPYGVKDTPQPAVISLNGTVASFGVTMFLAAFTGIPFGARRVNVLFSTGQTRAVGGEPRAGCPTCSREGAALRADSWPMIAIKGSRSSKPDVSEVPDGTA